MGWGLGDWVKKVKGLRSTYWLLRNSHEDIKYTIGNIVNIEIIMCGANKIYQDDHLVAYTMSNHWGGCTPETNIILYVNCN